MTKTIDLSAGRLALDGSPSVVLCSSVFPFRLPREQWDHRLQLVQESGYGMIDLYVHWGFHEQRSGDIDLSSPQRDLRHFLELAHERDLLVMARPGPYICSETDGGGLPWWLHGDHPDAPAALRTADPDYLAAVDRWFSAVMPILAEAQIGRGGPVALVQIENELDFFDCPDPDAYMEHLAERARELGIEVPIIACAGQGDLPGATGDAEGVVPTVNLYPDDASATFDEESRYYQAELARRDLPLMVTETNRVHLTLRREILAGARLVAPYLQTSGFDHLVLPSAGNWGDPGNLMTHDYDFGGYISPDGRRLPEYDEAVALSATLRAWGERLATATPAPLSSAPITGIATGGVLELPGGGAVIGPAELTGHETPVQLRPVGTTTVDAVVPAVSCPFWALDVPLAPWGAAGTLAVATAELLGAGPVDGVLQLTFVGGASSHVELSLPTPEGPDETVRLTGPGEAVSTRAGDPVRILVRERGASLADPELAAQQATGSLHGLGDRLLHAGTVHQTPVQGVAIPTAEGLGLADGRVQAELELAPEATEVLLLEAADLVRLELDGADRGVHVRHGAPISLPLAPGAVHSLRVTAEIWGRANFDDARRPALHLGAGRGVGTVLEVLASQDATDLWQVSAIPDRREHGELAVPPLRGLGGWSSPNLGTDAVYTRTLELPGGERLGVLRLQGLARPVHVALDDGPERLIAPDAPVIVLGEGEGRVRVRVRAPHVPDGFVDRVELLSTARPRVRGLRTLGQAELALLASGAAGAEDASWAPLPAGQGVHIAGGAPVLIRLDPGGADEGGQLLDLDGEQVQITVVVGGRRLSRHVLGDPVAAGGHPERSWIPASVDVTGGVVLLVEALAAGGGIFRGTRRALTAR